MKKIFSILAVVTLIAFVSACQKQNQTNTCNKDETFKVGLVTDSGGIDDRSFNQSTWEGLIRFAKAYDLCKDTNYKYLQSKDEVDYSPNLTTFAQEHLSLIVAPGFLFVDTGALPTVAEANPNQKFVIIDSVVAKPNVASAVFSEEQGSFLVGVAAALKAQELGDTKVGFVGGMDFDLIQKFEAGYEAGVHAIDPNIQVIVQYAGSFTSTSDGQTKAEAIFAQGARIIYHAAGGAGGGVIKAAKDKALAGQTAYVIGVDKDQYAEGVYDTTNNKSVILTSMMKRVDLAAFEVTRLTYEGKFPGNQVLLFNLANDGVGIPSKNPNLKDEWVAKINEFRTKIINGEVTVPTVPSRLQNQ